MQDPTPSPIDQPLSMAVHSLPDPALMTTPPSGRGKFFAFFLACSLPLLLAVFAFFVLKPEGQVNYGSLIHPARPMPVVTVTDMTNVAHPLEALKGQWLLVSVMPAACPEDCTQQLFIQKQLREMLNKDRDRMDKVWLVTDETALPASLAPMLSDVTVLRVPASVVQAWMLGQAPVESAQGQLFVVDPQGYAMLRMPTPRNGKDASAAKNVLQKLLTASAVWDRPGR